MKILIVDDETPARRRLRDMVETLDQHRVVGEASNGNAALAAVREHEPDLVLLDVRMPGLDGLSTARRLSELTHPPAIVLVTAYGEHALQAFDVEAVDYLVKPVRPERLEAALLKAQRLNRAQVNALAKQADPETVPHILCRRRQQEVLIRLDEIRCFLAEHKYVWVHHRDGADLIEDSLVQLEKRFPEQLLRVHRAALVNTAYIAGIERQGRANFVLLRDSDQRVEISRRHLSTVRAAVRRYAPEPVV